MKKYLLLIASLLLIAWGAAWAWMGPMMAGPVSSAACAGTVGNNATTDLDAIYGTAQRIVLRQVQATCSGPLGTMYVRVSTFNDTDRNGTFVLYSDNGSNVPNQVLEYHAFAQDGNAAAHWASQVFAYEVVNGTRYWIGMIAQAAVSQQLYSSETGGVSYRGLVANYTSPPAWSSVTSPVSQTRNMESYFEY